MDRRRFLSLAALLAAAPAAGAANVGDRVAWRDVVLLDGTTIPAARLGAGTTIVEFWASWCPFCARQNPHLEKLWRDVRGRGVELVTFSIDKDPAKARDYVAKNGYTFPAAMADDARLAQFDLRRGLPVLFVLEPGGRVAQRESGEMFEEDLRALARYARGATARAGG